MTLEFVVEAAPVGVNHAYKPARWGKRHGLVLTDEGAAFKDRIRSAAALAARGAPLAGDVEVRVKFYWPTAAGDVDSPLKLTLDSLQGAAIANDRQVKRVTAERFTDRARPRIVVTVEALTEHVDEERGRAPKTARPRLPKTSAFGASCRVPLRQDDDPALPPAVAESRREQAAITRARNAMRPAVRSFRGAP